MGNCSHIIRGTAISINAGLSLNVDRKYISPDLALREAVELCRLPSPIAMMAGMMKRICASDPDPTYVALYVIEPDGIDDVCKVGVSCNPAKRLAQLQGAHWADLKLAFLAWTRNGEASKIEKTALRAAAEMDWRLNGEWLASNSDEAGELLIKAARYCGADIADSAAELENMTFAVDKLHKTRRGAREAVMPLP